MSFKLINNLIIIPIEINGSKLTFILDSGVGAPVIFNLTPSDTLELNQMEKIKLRGLGDGDSVDAVRSKNNRIKINNIYASNQDLYIIYNEKLDLTSKLGITVHGLIGYSLLKDFIVTINYNSKKITFSNPTKYKYKECKKCETLDIRFHKKKPFINGEIVMDNTDQSIPVKLLVDLGGTDSLWLFEDENIIVPDNSFEDFIGEGISGSIFGKRGKINTFSLKSFVLNNPNVAFLDSTSTIYAKRVKDRNGSVGSEILKRFKIILDYPNSKITLKKNNHFNDDFSYNMSGIELIHAGKTLVSERYKTSFQIKKENNSIGPSTVLFDYEYQFKYKPIYEITYVRKGSSADIAGVLKGDLLIGINGIQTHNHDLLEIIEKFYGKENKKIKIIVNRNGEVIPYEFRLKDLLKKTSTK